MTFTPIASAAKQSDRLQSDVGAPRAAPSSLQSALERLVGVDIAGYARYACHYKDPASELSPYGGVPEEPRDRSWVELF
jgi:hypothetical protein